MEEVSKHKIFMDMVCVFIFELIICKGGSTVKSKRLTSFVLAFLMIFTSFGIMAFAEVENTSDISGHWAELSIQKWVDQGSIKGYPDGTFRPDNNITRAEFMELVNREFGYTAKAAVTYVDINSNDWYFDTVSIAQAAGYITGYPDGTIRPNNQINREEAATIIMKILKLTANTAAANIFTDASNLTWSKGPVGATVEAKIMIGYLDGSFGPQFQIKRGESVISLERAYNYSLGPITPLAPTVTRNDATDKVSGMTVEMEYKLDSANYTSYIASIFDALDFAGNHTLLVRYAAAGINPFGPSTTLTFTAASTGGSGGGSSSSTVAVSAITITPTAIDLTVGGTGTITATVAPTNATNKTVSWTSSDEDVATVAGGVVTPMAAGSTTITAITANGGFTATTLVTVNFTQAIASGGFDNTAALNEAIASMWSLAYYKGTFDAAQVSQAYVDVINSAVPGGPWTVEAVAVPVELIIPEGKVFSSAEIMHDVNDELSSTDAVKMEANFGDRLIAWMNTNMAYGWEQSDGEVVYTYVVTWTDATKTEYAITMEDADTSYEIAMVITDSGLIDDNSFNQSVWEGIVDYAVANTKTHRYFNPKEQSTDAYLAAIQLAVEGGAKVVVGPGFLFEEPIYMAQELYPDVKFILIDGNPHNADYSDYRIDGNTVSILFAEEQSGYLAGYAAVKDGYTKLGFMGGMSIGPVVRYGYGFLQGADAAAIEMDIESIDMKYHYTGNFNDTPENQALAASWYEEGTEVIFAAGGMVGNSVMLAAEEAGKAVIGVDVDQSSESDTVITSAMKGLSAAVQKTLTEYYADAFPGGQSLVLDAEFDGVALPMDTSKFTTFIQDDYEAIYAKLADGSVTVNNDTEADPQTELGLSIVIITMVE